MKTLTRSLILVVCLTTALSGLSRADSEPIRILLFSDAYGHRHGASIATLRDRLRAHGEFTVDSTEDVARISLASLESYDVLVLNNASGNVPFSDRQKVDLMTWRQAGGGVVAVHSAVENYGWPQYGRMIGATFQYPPHFGSALNVIEDRFHPFMRHFPQSSYALDDEYYLWHFNPRENVHVLASLDQRTAGAWGPVYPAAQPLTWCHDYGGRVFYTMAGHNASSWLNEDIWSMLLQAIRWAGDRLEADCSPSVPRSPSRLEAEDAERYSGWIAASTEKGAELTITGIADNGWMRLPSIDLTDVTSISVRLSVETSPQLAGWQPVIPRPASGGRIGVRIDKMREDDPPRDPCDVSDTFGRACARATDIGGAEIAPSPPGWKTVTIPIQPQSGEHDLILVFTDDVSQTAAGARLFTSAFDAKGLFTIDWIQLGRAS